MGIIRARVFAVSRVISMKPVFRLIRLQGIRALVEAPNLRRTKTGKERERPESDPMTDTEENAFAPRSLKKMEQFTGGYEKGSSVLTPER
jgi:hypothetical protein